VNQDVVAKQVAAMGEADLDALVAISPENFAYVTGFVVPSQPVLRWRHAGVVTTRDGRAGVLAVDMEATTVRSRLAAPGPAAASGSPAAPAVRVWAEFEDDAMPVLAALLGDLGLRSARVGIETDYLPARDMDRLRALVPGVRWEAAQGLFDRLRMLKTPREVDLLRRLSRITDGALEAALASVRAGSSEMDLAAALTGAVYRRGADGFRFLIVASGERSQYPNVGPTERRLQAGDVVRLEVFGLLGGYHAGVCRTATVGPPSAEAGRIWRHLVDCRDAVFEAIRPGARAAEVYGRFLERFAPLGFAPISFVGHGIGQFLHEAPYLGARSDAVLEAGMVLGVEPLCYVPGRFGFQNKDMVAVTPGGCELLSDVVDTDRLFPIP
jgi:Xaa-Pro aminopeptidase